MYLKKFGDDDVWTSRTSKQLNVYQRWALRWPFVDPSMKRVGLLLYFVSAGMLATAWVASVNLSIVPASNHGVTVAIVSLCSILALIAGPLLVHGLAKDELSAMRLDPTFRFKEMNGTPGSVFVRMYLESIGKSEAELDPVVVCALDSWRVQSWQTDHKLMGRLNNPRLPELDKYREELIAYRRALARFKMMPLTLSESLVGSCELLLIQLRGQLDEELLREIKRCRLEASRIATDITHLEDERQQLRSTSDGFDQD